MFLSIPLILSAALLATGCVGKAKYEDAVAQLAAEQQRNQQLSADLSGTRAANESLEQYAGELESDVDEMRRALQELRSRQSLADERIAQYRDLTERFAEMIDSGALEVKIVDGRMVLNLTNDILFPSGSAALSPEGKETIQQVAEILTTMQDREYQIEGHTDDKPISSKQFPSNWELGSARALTVVKALEEGGMQPTSLSAASFAYYKPVGSNDTEQGRAENRRIEIVLLPDLSELPGFDQLEQLAQN